jgi:hypothetical protein
MRSIRDCERARARLKLSWGNRHTLRAIIRALLWGFTQRINYELRQHLQHSYGLTIGRGVSYFQPGLCPTRGMNDLQMY